MIFVFRMATNNGESPAKSTRKNGARVYFGGASFFAAGLRLLISPPSAAKRFLGTPQARQAG
jgi:hypothetical protein